MARQTASSRRLPCRSRRCRRRRTVVPEAAKDQPQQAEEPPQQTEETPQQTEETQQPQRPCRSN